MKIAHISDRLPGFHARCGGAEYAAFRIIELLRDCGEFDVTAFMMKPDTNSQMLVNWKVLPSMEYFCGRKISVLLSWLKNRTTPFDLISFLSSFFEFKKNRPDIVHVHKATLLSFSVIQSAVMLNIPVVFSVYDYWLLCPGGFLVDNKGQLCRKFHGLHCLKCDVFNKAQQFSRLALLFRWNAVFNYYFDKIKAFVVLSKASAEFLKSYGINEEKTHVIPQIIPNRNQPEMTPGFSRKGFRVFFAGWMDRKKGLHVLIKAMPEILKSIPDVSLCIFDMPADSLYQGHILKFIEENHLQKNVSIFGRVSQEILEEHLVSSDCVVVPEQWENMSPVIIAEALKYGKPVIASRIGGIPEFVFDGENGFLVDKDDISAFADKIIWIAQHKTDAIAMGKKSQDVAREIFDRRNILNKYKKLYANLLV